MTVKLVNSLIALAIVTVLLAAGWTAYSMLSNDDQPLSSVSSEPGKIFQGKLNALALDTADLPPAYGPYELYHVANGEGYLSPNALKDQKGRGTLNRAVTQVYIGPRVNNDSMGVSSRIQLTTYQTVGDARNFFSAGDRAAEVLANVSNSSIPSKTTFPNIGDENRYFVDSRIVLIRIGNLIAEFNLHFPSTSTDVDVLFVLTNWLNQVSTYQSGTSADVQAENVGRIN